MNSTAKNLMFWMVAALVIFVFWSVSSHIQRNERPLSFSDFTAQVEKGHVNNVTFTGSRISGEFKNGQGFRTFAPPQVEGLVKSLIEKGVVVNARDENSSSWLRHIISWTPIVIMIAFLIFFMRQMQGSGNRALSRADRRLVLKARIHELLSGSDADLSGEEISSKLSESKAELQRALYEMLREETIQFTTGRKYRVKTVE